MCWVAKSIALVLLTPQVQMPALRQAVLLCVPQALAPTPLMLPAVEAAHHHQRGRRRRRSLCPVVVVKRCRDLQRGRMLCATFQGDDTSSEGVTVAAACCQTCGKGVLRPADHGECHRHLPEALQYR